MQPSRGAQRSGYNYESTRYDHCVSQARLLVTVNVCLLYDIICDIDDLASCCINISVRQQVFCNFELAALLLLNTIYIYIFTL